MMMHDDDDDDDDDEDEDDEDEDDDGSHYPVLSPLRVLLLMHCDLATSSSPSSPLEKNKRIIMCHMPCSFVCGSTNFNCLASFLYAVSLSLSLCVCVCVSLCLCEKEGSERDERESRGPKAFTSSSPFFLFSFSHFFTFC